MIWNTRQLASLPHPTCHSERSEESAFDFPARGTLTSSTPPPASSPSAKDDSATHHASGPDATASRSRPPQTPPHNPYPAPRLFQSSAQKSSNTSDPSDLFLPKVDSA